MSSRHSVCFTVSTMPFRPKRSVHLRLRKRPRSSRARCRKSCVRWTHRARAQSHSCPDVVARNRELVVHAHEIAPRLPGRNETPRRETFRAAAVSRQDRSKPSLGRRHTFVVAFSRVRNVADARSASREIAHRVVVNKREVFVGKRQRPRVLPARVCVGAARPEQHRVRCRRAQVAGRRTVKAAVARQLAVVRATVHAADKRLGAVSARVLFNVVLVVSSVRNTMRSASLLGVRFAAARRLAGRRRLRRTVPWPVAASRAQGLGQRLGPSAYRLQQRPGRRARLTFRGGFRIPVFHHDIGRRGRIGRCTGARLRRDLLGGMGRCCHDNAVAASVSRTSGRGRRFEVGGSE